MLRLISIGCYNDFDTREQFHWAARKQEQVHICMIIKKHDQHKTFTDILLQAFMLYHRSCTKLSIQIIIADVINILFRCSSKFQDIRPITVISSRKHQISTYFRNLNNKKGEHEYQFGIIPEIHPEGDRSRHCRIHPRPTCYHN